MEWGKYRHKKDGYEVQAGRYMKTYRVYGYPSFPACIYLAVDDFETLFEPSPETPDLAGSFPADLPQATRGGLVKEYKHKKHGYVVEAELHDYRSQPGKFYRVESYRPQLLANPLAVPEPSKTYYTILGMDDFNELFKLVPEYCCSEFESMVQKGIYYLKDNE